MIDSSSLLSSYETCDRKGYYAQSWQSQRMISSRMVSEAIRTALIAPAGGECGEIAGSEVLQLAEDRGLDTYLHEIYPTVMHHAALSDIAVSCIRKPGDDPWLIPNPIGDWHPSCLMSPEGDRLRRVVLVTHWTDEREQSEKRSWYCAGEVAAYDMPMDMIVLVIGQQRNGKRHSPWTRGFLHPANRQLRFRKKERSTSEVFNSRWIQINREDHAEISRETWLNAMLKDDVLPEACFRIEVPRLDQAGRDRILDMGKRKLERLHATKEKPEANLSSCDWPVACPFKRCCWSNPEREPSEKTGFIPVQNLYHRAAQSDS